MDDFSELNLLKFLHESCRAELTHWLAIPPFIVFGLFTPPAALPIMFVYALAVNMPCILAQRYNRPRIQKHLIKMSEKK
jgi:glycosyl-4,4'-diaponeurosporenoate acyltransferase